MFRLSHSKLTLGKLSVALLFVLLSNNAAASRCASIHSWTGCHLEDHAENCDKKVVKIDFTDNEGKTLSQWLAKTDIRDSPELKAHVTKIMRNFMSVNSYLDTHCSDGPCLTGHEHLCQDG